MCSNQEGKFFPAANHTGKTYEQKKNISRKKILKLKADKQEISWLRLNVLDVLSK
jgi:hypothetical protein